MTSGSHTCMVAHESECVSCPSTSSHSLLCVVRSSAGQAVRPTDNKRNRFVDYKVTEPESSFSFMLMQVGTL